MARSLRAFGDDATVMLERFWSGGSQPLTSQMVDSLRDLQTFSDKPEAYPILHFFHSPEPRFALSRAVLDVAEALFWWSYAVAPEQRLNKAVSEICFDALRTYCGPRVSENDQPSECPELSQAKWQRLGLSPVAVDHAAQDMYRQLRGQLEKICRDDGWGYSP